MTFQTRRGFFFGILGFEPPWPPFAPDLEASLELEPDWARTVAMGETSVPAALLGASEVANILGVDSLSILFNHRSFQKPAVSLGSDFWKEGSLERMGECPLETWRTWGAGKKHPQPTEVVPGQL